MVPKQEGGAMNQTEPNMKGIHDNPVRGSHPSGTVTLTSQWKHQYLLHTYQDKREWQAGINITRMTGHLTPNCKPCVAPAQTPLATPHQNLERYSWPALFRI